MNVFLVALSSLLEVLAIILVVYGYAHEDKVIAWENKVIRKVKNGIRKQLRKSKKIVAWAEKPTKHGRPDEDFIAWQIKVHGDAWK